jgi:hypothetical protein
MNEPAYSLDPAKFAPAHSTLGIVQRFVAELGAFTQRLGEDICAAHEVANASPGYPHIDWNSLMFVDQALRLLADETIPLPPRLQHAELRERWRAMVRKSIN